MGRNTRAKSHKTKPVQRGRRKSRPAAKAAHRSGAARQLDQVAQEFDGAVEGLQNSLEKLRESLPELVALGVRRDRLRRMKTLAEDGILDSLQRLATALETIGEALPDSLVSLRRSARMAVDHLCRAFDVQAVYKPGESLTVMQEQVKDFDWSADHSGELNFPAQVEVLRSGWKGGDAIFVLPKVRVSQPANNCITNT